MFFIQTKIQMSLLEFISNRIPRYSKNERDAEWEKGRLYGQREMGYTRDAKSGRFASLHPRRNLGVIHSSDETCLSLSAVESPDRRESRHA